MRNSAGVRWFSSSSSRKLRKIGSAPSIARCSPSFFSCVEKYGEKKNTCIRWSAVERVGELAQLLARDVDLVLVECGLEQRPGVDDGDLFHVRLALLAREGREVQLGHGLLDQAALVLGRQRLPGHLLGGQDREVGDLGADLLDRATGLRLDVLARLLEQLLAALPALDDQVGLGLLARLARAGDDLVGLLARRGQALAVLGQQLVRLLARALGGVDRRPRSPSGAGRAPPRCAGTPPSRG